MVAREAVVGIGEHLIMLDLQGWINDLAMVLFFFVAGLEIKREVTQGELRDGAGLVADHRRDSAG